MPTLTLTAGQKCPLPLTFAQPDGSPLDLTGATVYLTAKRSTEDADAEAVLDLWQDDHEDAAAGRTSLPVDLSDVPDQWFSAGVRLTASLWVEDSLGHRIPYGNLAVEVQPSVRRWTDPSP